MGETEVEPSSMDVSYSEVSHVAIAEAKVEEESGNDQLCFELEFEA